MIQKNPFTSKIFTKIWCKHFNENQPGCSFDWINGVQFLKSSNSVYVNIGKQMTKGMSYTTQATTQHGFKGKVALIYDVPEYFIIHTKKRPKHIALIKIRQYPGFLAKLEAYRDFNSYFSASFSKKSRYKFKSYQKNLENTFNIRYVHWFGDMPKDEYDVVFEQFHVLLKKRFDAKLETNNNLDPKEWNFYQDSSYQLILEKKASLFVVYNGATPIAISLNYFSEDILFFAMTVFDIDYFNYNIGKVHLMELFKWCFKNNIKIFDLSKGYYDYKQRWANTTYHFEHHILYDANSIKATVLAYMVGVFFKLKQYLRDKNINTLLHKIKYRFTSA